MREPASLCGWPAIKIAILALTVTSLRLMAVDDSLLPHRLIVLLVLLNGITWPKHRNCDWLSSRKPEGGKAARAARLHAIKHDVTEKLRSIGGCQFALRWFAYLCSPSLKCRGQAPPPLDLGCCLAAFRQKFSLRIACTI